MATGAFLVQLVAGLGFAVHGAMALTDGWPRRARQAEISSGRGRAVVGAFELLGGLALLGALAQPFLVFFIAALLALLAAALLLSPRLRPPSAKPWVIGGLLISALTSAVTQPLGLRVLALPKAAVLPVEPVEARLVKTYGEGVWFESVKAAPDGTLYLTANQGENYATGDKSRVHAEVIARTSDGNERVFFELPRGATAGVIAFDKAGRMFMTGQGSALGIWRLTPDGKGTLFAKLPQGAWPNGMTVGPDQLLYVADSALGTIWRVNPDSGAVDRAVESDALRARRFIALAPGANGIHFFGRQLFVTVSDAARVLEFRLEQNGSLTAPRVLAEGIPGDDFAIDTEGTLYITTHPFNTIVRVTQDGKRTVVATAAQGLVGATDATFGTQDSDRDLLYAVTDGGAFSGDPRARGALLALHVTRNGGR